MSDWYYAVDNEQKGPINESELKANFATNKLPGDTLVWKDGMDNWTAANQVPAFSFRPPPAPAKVQPSATGAPAEAPASTTTVASTTPDSTTPVALAEVVGKPEAIEVDAEDAEKNKIFGILAYLGILCLVPVFAAKNSAFAQYHANQGLVLFIVELAVGIVLTILNSVLATIGLSILSAILGIAWLGVLALLVIGIINAAAGKCVPLPLIGGIKLLK